MEQKRMLSRHLSTLKTLYARFHSLPATVAQLPMLLRSKLYVTSYYLIGSAIVSGAGGFFFWLLAAQVTTPAAIGVATAAISGAVLLSAIADAGLVTAALYFAAGSPARTAEYMNNAAGVTWLSVGVAAIIFVLGIPLWASGLLAIHNDGLLLITFVLFTLLNHFLLLQDAAMLARRTAAFVFWRNLACNAPPILLLVLLQPLQLANLPFVAYTLPNIVVSLVLGLAILPRSLPGYRYWGTIRLPLLGEMLRYALPTYAANLLWGATGLLMPLIAINTLPGSQAGAFAINWALLNLLLVLPRSVCTSVFVEGANQPGSLRRVVRQALLLIGGATLPAILLFWLLGPLVLSLFGAAYHDTSALPPLLLSVLPFGVNGVGFMLLRVQRRLPAAMAFAGLLTLVVSGLAVGLARSMGMSGLAWGWLLGHTVLALLAGLMMVYRLPNTASKS
jgi:O-antigen/teichoic acid export membrane protein